MVRFQVDPVEPARDRLPASPLAERVGPCLALGGDGARQTLSTQGVHPLLAAVHQAFAEHRPLVLSPEAIALTLTQGVALHVRLRAEDVRERLVRHAGREVLSLEVLEVPALAEAWGAQLLRLRDALVDEVGPGWGRFFGCGFSSSGPVDEVAAAVVMLDAFSPYYDYLMVCVCGIPEITLLGEVSDWEELRERVEILPELGLSRWATSLRPILDQFVRAARGAPEPRFWQEIYKPRAVYRADQIAGWVGRLFPYVGVQGRYDQPNPMLEVPHEELVAREAGDFLRGIGSIATDMVPAGPSSALLHLVLLDGSRRVVTLEGGLLGVEQDAQGRLVPFAGFVIREGQGGLHRMRAVAARIVAEHTSEPPRASEPYAGSAELAVLYGALRSATLELGTGRWTLLPHTERGHSVCNSVGHWLMAHPVAELPGGRRLASCLGRWVVLPAAFAEIDARARQQLEEVRQQLEDGLITPEEAQNRRADISLSHPLLGGGVPVLRGSLSEILHHALEHEGALEEVDELGALYERLLQETRRRVAEGAAG
jgi:hypothetical protein